MSFIDRTSAGPSANQSTSRQRRHVQVNAEQRGRRREQRAAQQRLDRRHVADQHHRALRVARRAAGPARAARARADVGEALPARRRGVRAAPARPSSPPATSRSPRRTSAPPTSPKSVSTRSSSTTTGAPDAAATASAVLPRAPQRRRHDHVDAAPLAQPRRGRRRLRRGPSSVSGMSPRPANRRSADSGVSPCRSSSVVVGPAARLPPAPARGGPLSTGRNGPRYLPPRRAGILVRAGLTRRVARLTLGRVHRLVGQPVGPLVTRSAAPRCSGSRPSRSAACRPSVASARMAGSLIFQRPDICSTTSLESIRTSTSAPGARSPAARRPGDQPGVLGHVVRGGAQAVVQLGQHLAGLRVGDQRAVAGRAGVAARAAVRLDDEPPASQPGLGGPDQDPAALLAAQHLVRRRPRGSR